jgi:serine/threonine protein kinase
VAQAAVRSRWLAVCSTSTHPPVSSPPSLFMLLLQGGLQLSSVLSILVQAVAGLLHLHSLGILHRDLRAANLLLDALDPLHARVADFGVSHLLSAFAAGLRATDLTSGKVPMALRGNTALGPMQVCDCTWSTHSVQAAHVGACLIVASPLLELSFAVERPGGVRWHYRWRDPSHHRQRRVHGGQSGVRAADWWDTSLPLAGS